MTFKILGHRGGRKEVSYENSTDAFQYALKNVDGFEADVCRTKEHDAFLIHETVFIEEVVYELSRHLDEASKITVGQDHLEDIPTETVSSLTLKNGEHLPRLKDIIKEFSSYPEATLNLELKGEDTAKATVNAIKHAIDNNIINKEQIVVSSFNHEQLLKVRNLMPSIKIGVLYVANFQPKQHMLYPWSDEDHNCYIPFERKLLDTDLIREINPELFNLEYTDMTADNVEYIKKLYPNSQGMTWWLPEYENHPSQDREFWNRVMAPTVKDFLYAVISDYPLEMKNYYEKNYT
jgi:glycerophosphoryl diester phosphodiesterase